MKIEATEPEARDWLLERLYDGGGIAELVMRRRFGSLFYFADQPVSDGDFASGRLMSSSGCDEELEKFVREQKDLLAVFQNSWSKIGDLNNADAKARGTFTYQGSYYHFSELPGLLSGGMCRRVSVTQFGVVFLLAQARDIWAMLSARAEDRVLSDADADAIAAAARFVFVGAFDEESWLGGAVLD